MKYTFIAHGSSAVGNVLKMNGVSRRLISKLKRVDEGITLNGRPARTVDIANEGDIIVISMEDVSDTGEKLSADVPIVYRDEALIIFDKPSNMPIHPSSRHRSDTLGNYFSYLYPDKTYRPINRLDRDTTGLCAAALDPFAAKLLQHGIQKVYYAAVCGIIEQGGTIDLPVARERESIIKRCVRSDGQRAVTHYAPIQHSDKYTLLEIHLDTGRTHQIRVHFSHIGFPLAGDGLYGGSTADIERQALHCGKMVLSHPVTGEEMLFTSPLPKDIERLFID